MKVINLLVVILISVACSQMQSAPVKSVDSPLLENRTGFKDCYIQSESYQSIEKSAQGNVQFLLSIGPEGEVYNDKITNSDFKENAFHNCLLKELRSIRFLNNKNEENLIHTLKFIQVKK